MQEGGRKEKETQDSEFVAVHNSLAKSGPRVPVRALQFFRWASVSGGGGTSCRIPRITLSPGRLSFRDRV